MSDILSSFIEAAIGALLGSIADRFWVHRPRLKFSALSWSLTFQDRDNHDEIHDLAESPPTSAPEPIARYSLRFRVCNKDGEATELQQFWVQFTRGPRFDTTVIFTDSEPFGPTCDGYALGECMPAPTGMRLPAGEHAERELVGFVQWTPAVCQADSVWLFASTPRGARYRWRVARLKADQERES